MPPYTFVRNGKVVDPDIVLTADVYPHALDRTVYAWDGGHHIPLCVKWPDNIKPGATCRETVGLIDIFATLADITGQPLKNDEAEDSFSFRKVLDGDMQTPTRDHLIYLSSAGKLAIKKGPWKYIEGIGSGGFTLPSKLLPVKNGPTGQLYNLTEDSLESNNLFLRKKEVVNELSGLLREISERGYSRNLVK